MKTPTKIKENKTTPKVHQELSKGGTYLKDNRSTTLHQRKLKESFDNTNQPVVQRVVDDQQAVQDDKFNEALNHYRTLEAPGLKKKNRFRLNPFRLGYGNSYFVKNSALIRRFQRAPRTILKFSIRKLGRGTLGLTSLFCYKNDGTELNYDECKTEVRKLMLQKEIQFFKVDVCIDEHYINSNHTKIGEILQTITHEMTVHAENILDYIESYWKHYYTQTSNRNATPPVPTGNTRPLPPLPPGADNQAPPLPPRPQLFKALSTAKHEHENFVMKQVVSYNRLRHRLKNNKKLADIYKGFKGAHDNDRTTLIGKHHRDLPGWADAKTVL